LPGRNASVTHRSGAEHAPAGSRARPLNAARLGV